jgi:hypothetical protein
MPCGSCVDKLARKLMEHFKISETEAYERARKGIERHEKAEIRTVTKEEMKALGFDPDYSKSCLPSSYQTITCPDTGVRCTENVDCTEISTQSCSCPDPLPNSTYVSNTCSFTVGTTCAYCNPSPTLRCRTSGTWKCSGLCYYNCTPPYVWNGSECVLPTVVPVGGIVQQAKLQDII